MYQFKLVHATFGTALAMGMHPGEFQFNQQEMRRHLWQCLERWRCFLLLEEEDQENE